VRFEGANLLGSLAKGKRYPYRVGTGSSSPPQNPCKYQWKRADFRPERQWVPCPCLPRWSKTRTNVRISPKGQMGLGLGCQISLKSAGWGPGIGAGQRRA